MSFENYFLQRRQFLSALARSSSLALVPTCLVKGAMAANDPWREEFSNALAEKPWLAGYKTVGADHFEGEATVQGQWPTALRGTLYRNGPAVHEIGNFRYHHWFDGDGLLQAWRLGEDPVQHQARLIQTYKHEAERKAGRALYPGFGTVPPDPVGVTSPDAINPANISVLPHHGRLLALWEAGSAWDMDPDSLETRGVHRFSPETQGVPFSAHPRVEPDGTLWNFGYVSSAGLLLLWHIDATGKLVKMGKIPCDPISMPHDFLVTSRHILIMMPPFNFERGQRSSFLDSHQWQPGQSTRLLVIDKNDFSLKRTLELPAQWVFHFGNAWEDSNGIIRFDGARSSDPLTMTETFSQVMRGREIPPSSVRHYQYRVDTRSGEISEEALLPVGIDSEFPAIDPRVSTQQYRQVVVLSRDETDETPHDSFNRVSKLDLEKEQLDSYRYEDHQLPEEHLFIPQPGSSPDSAGWIVGTFFDWREERTGLSVFDAADLDAGPIATAILPYALPLGLHGKFVAS